MNHRRSIAALVLAALPATGCFYQATFGAQRSPDGSWGTSAGLAVGLHFDLHEVVGVGLGGDAAAVGFSNQDGTGHASPGPVMAEGHVKLNSGQRHALAIAGEIGVPYGGGAHLTLDRTGEQGLVRGARVMRWSAGLSHRYLLKRSETTLLDTRIGSTSELYTVAGVQSFAIYGPAFDDVVTFGPSATIGFLASADTSLYLFQCAVTLLLDCKDD